MRLEREGEEEEEKTRGRSIDYKGPVYEKEINLHSIANLGFNEKNER